jgi:hypothetical protein
MVGKAQISHGARSELNSVFGLEKWIGGSDVVIPHRILSLFSYILINVVHVF